MFPSNGEYNLNVIGKQTGTFVVKKHLFSFKINVKI